MVNQMEKFIPGLADLNERVLSRMFTAFKVFIEFPYWVINLAGTPYECRIFHNVARCTPSNAFLKSMTLMVEVSSTISTARCCFVL